MYFKDERRFGLFTRNGKSITPKGVKPVCPFVQDFRNSYMFGAYSPIAGSSLLLNMPYCNTECVEVFLDELSKQQPDKYKILFFDIGAFHKATRLVLPNNIALCFRPPYSPELNRAEKIWTFLKRKITNKAFTKLVDFQKLMDNVIQKYLDKETIKSITHINTFNTLHPNPLSTFTFYFLILK